MTEARGRFITFEGGEGAGKSTQIGRFAAWLEARGVHLETTREPGGTPGAEAIRALVLDGEASRWSPMAEALLVTAARADHVERVIGPALRDGRWVLCDRFADSTRAYQGGAGGLGLARVDALQEIALGEFRPDLTFILDIDPETGAGRVDGRAGEKSRFDSRERAYHAAVRAAFLEIAEADPDRCVVIDAGREADAVQAAIRAAASARLTLPAETAS